MSSVADSTRDIASSSIEFGPERNPHPVSPMPSKPWKLANASWAVPLKTVRGNPEAPANKTRRILEMTVVEEQSQPALTPEEIHLFRHNGYLKLGTLSPDLVERLKESIWHDIRNEVEPVVRNKEGNVVRISDLVDRDPIFLESASGPQVLDPLECLMGPNIELIKNRHNHATLRTASEKYDGLHRDIKQWTRTIFTVLFYLEETTVENGCTHFVPGSHHFPGVTGKIGDDPWTHAVANQAVPLPVPAGTFIVIDSMVMHRAGNNTTDNTRISMTVGYHSVDELIDVPNPKRILVRGEGLYSGNDRSQRQRGGRQ
jgi:hypothetical protein